MYQNVSRRCCCAFCIAKCSNCGCAIENSAFPKLRILSLTKPRMVPSAPCLLGTEYSDFVKTKKPPCYIIKANLFKKHYHCTYLIFVLNKYKIIWPVANVRKMLPRRYCFFFCLQKKKQYNCAKVCQKRH